MKCDLRQGLTTITGPSKSGKSLMAEKLLKNKQNVVYLATGQSATNDTNWNKRIELHKERRPEQWKLIEFEKNIEETISTISDSNYILIDSLGGFITTNLNIEDDQWTIISNKFIDSILNFKGSIILVIEEVGWGLVANTKIGNLFRDRIGLLSQELERVSVTSWLVIQGRAIDLKKIGIRI